MQSYNLTLGANTIVPDILQVHLEQLYGSNVFRISPLNFSIDLYTSRYYLWYNVSYIFSSSLKLDANTQVVAKISSENNSVPASSCHRDGNVEEIFSRLGFAMHVREIRPEKTILDRDVQKCRPTPFNEMLYSQVSKEILSCIHHCKLNISNGQRLDSFKETLPNCSGKTADTCYQRALNKARKAIDRKGLK